jgi:hypothetical protein
MRDRREIRGVLDGINVINGIGKAEFRQEGRVSLCSE